jgi:CRISPR/Cas system-associated exonuclease Cas4 (RecB family)
VDEGVDILEKYHKTVAPTVQPLFLPELDLVAPVPGSKRRLRAIIDVVADVKSPFGTHKNVVRDTKTTSRMYSQEQGDTDPQLTIGAYLLEKAKGIKAKTVQFDVIVRKKGGAEMRSVTSDRGPDEFAAMERDVALVAKSIADGHFYRTSNHQTCNWCGYNSLCWPKRAWSTPQ